MNDVIAHRGPDSHGYAVFVDRTAVPLAGPATDKEVLASGLAFSPKGQASSAASMRGWAALGHQRLSIIDLSPSGHQPMCDASGRYWITFNGEVYNYVELRRELQSQGHSFVGSSDTEVVLAAFSEWGDGCVARFIGMFAFVIVDTWDRRVLAARDHFGIKPLYVWRDPRGRVAFASEVKQFTRLPGWQARLDGRRAYDFLNFGIFDHTERTLFRDVRQIRGGELVSAAIDDVGSLPVRRWWSLEPEPFDGTFDEAAAEFARRFDESVHLHLRSDVPVGSCLSGGLDSSALVCVANRQLRRSGDPFSQIAVSATSDDPKVDESRYMRLVADTLGIDVHTVQPTMDAIPGLLDRLTWHHDEPFGSTSLVAQWLVFEAARAAGLKVMLDGQGADEQLAGYHPYFAWRFQELLRAGHLARLAREVRRTADLHGDSLWRLTQLTGYLMLPKSVGHWVGQVTKAPGQDPQTWLNLSALQAEERPDPLAETASRVPSVRGLSLAQLTSSNLPMLLHHEDRDSMAHSIESRVPFLDPRLVEFTVGLPSDYLIADGVTKRVLRQAMIGRMPEPVRTRMDKIGFQTAEERWMRRDEPTRVLDMVVNAIEQSDGVVQPAALTRARDVLAGRRPFDYVVWRIISFGAWMNLFGVRR